MRIHRIVCVAVVALSLSIGLSVSASAADIRVLCSLGLKAVFEELAPQFERASGHKVMVTFGLASGFKDQIQKGAAFDVAILTPPMIDDLVESKKIAADSRGIIARTGLGMMIRAGAGKPDVRTTESFKRALLAAQNIAFAREGASGVAFVAMIEKLGMAETLKAKLRPTATGEEVNELVLSGGAQFGILPLSEILGVKGTELGGMFPAEVQSYITMAGGVNASAGQNSPGRELIRFFMAPAATPVIRAKGMERN